MDGLNIMGKIDFLESCINSFADNILRHRERKGVIKKKSSFQNVSGEETARNGKGSLRYC